jgi:hypothetical protein
VREDGVKKRRAKIGVSWWAWRLTAALVLGVGCTLVVSYGGAVIDSDVDFGGYGNGSANYLLETNRWWDVVHFGSTNEGEDAVRQARSITAWREDVASGSSESSEQMDGAPCDVYLIGWPARCLSGLERDHREVRENLVDAPEWVEKIRFVRQPLPTRVWWPGMLANVGFFGGAWLLLLAGPGVVRQVIRRRRGGCAGCGYDVKGVAVCPECGRAVGRADAEASG